jgi:methyltransferase (TIGR00027 family)
MTMRDDRGSRTAERVAQRRAAHQLLDSPLVFDDPLALRVAAPDDDRSPLAPYLRAAFAVRSRLAEDELRAAVGRGVEQYVILGAGFDTFAYRNPFPSLRVFEADHPATQALKRERLASARIEIPSSMTFVPIDFATTSLAAALAASGFRGDAAAFVSWLGVVPYLELAAIRDVLAFVAALPAGTTIVFDYGVPPSSLSARGRAVFAWMAARVAAAGEPWKTFFAPADLVALLREIGFADVESFGPAELNARYFGGRSDGLRVGEMAHMVRAVV